MDEQTLQRVQERIAAAREGRFDEARFEAALKRSRKQVEALGSTAAKLEEQLPERLREAIETGLRTEVRALSRNLAEIRGLLNQALHRLERLEQELEAERQARVDDLALLVDLVSSGWRGVDERLRRLESEADIGPLAAVPARDTDDGTVAAAA
jgi:chromosome segregation ATPase